MTERALTIDTAGGRLSTALDLAERFHVPEGILVELAQAGKIPHYRVEGYSGFLFNRQEAKEWIAANLIHRIRGESLPAPTIKVIGDAPMPLRSSPPRAISLVEGLREMDPDLFCGVYFLCLGDEVVYVGQSRSIPARIKCHGDKSFDRAYFLSVLPSQLDTVEMAFIRALRPTLNRYEGPGGKRAPREPSSDETALVARSCSPDAGKA